MHNAAVAAIQRTPGPRVNLIAAKAVGGLRAPDSNRPALRRRRQSVRRADDPLAPGPVPSAATGRLLWGLDRPTAHIHSSGLCADLDPRHPGVESYAGERDFPQLRWIFSADGELLEFGRNRGGLAPRAAYWDADPQRELLIGRTLSDFESGKTHDVAVEGAVIAVADVLGDWREEIITTLPGELRIYTTTIPATDRRVTLMQDPIYRLDVATLSQAYMQVPGTTKLPAHDR